MRWVIAVLVLVAGIIAGLAIATSPPGTGGLPAHPPATGGSSINPVYVQHQVPSEVTALYTKNISAATPFIIVDLYSGDPNDPVTLSVIAPDKTLGPYTDISDGRNDGRIYLKISRDGGLTPGTWVFRVQSSKNIAIFNWKPKYANTTDGNMTGLNPDDSISADSRNETGVVISRP